MGQKRSQRTGGTPAKHCPPAVLLAAEISASALPPLAPTPQRATGEIVSGAAGGSLLPARALRELRLLR